MFLCGCGCVSAPVGTIKSVRKGMLEVPELAWTRRTGSLMETGS